MRHAVNWFRLGAPIAMLIAFVILRFAVVRNLEEQQSSFFARQGMWPAFEQERQMLLLRDTVLRISLGAAIPAEQYRLREDLALGRTTATLLFFQQSNLPAEQRTILRTLEEHAATYKHMVGDVAPDPATARRLLPLLDELITTGHDLVNYRREAMFLDARQDFNLIDRLRLLEIVLVFCTLLSATWIIYLERQANRRLQMLLLQSEDLAIEQERNRLAREIHDGLGHHIHNTRLYLTLVEQDQHQRPDAAYQALLVARQEASAAQTELYRALDALYISPGDGALEPLVQELVRDCQLAGLEAIFAVHGEPRPLPPQVHHTLYRIIQEALTNVQRHAMADHAQIELDYRHQHKILLRVADDGVGISPGDQREGYGLRNMRTRVELLKGQIEMRPQVPQGITLCVTLPIR